ncbi:MAG: GNAT family N-acetyltransferase [Candidatus Thorarchaeota archaeon]|nr:MAG: GNAT family N-acetyltransferase [Candidatus Thorarchaeota archaeon]
MLPLKEIAKLERIAFNAWRARDLEYLGEWILRANDGITRRANSALPIGSPKMETSKAIEHVIGFYESRGLPPRFQMSPACEPSNLDDTVQAFGFELGLTVSIQTAPIDSVASNGGKHEVDLIDAPTPSWLNAYAKGGNFDRHSLATRKGIMDRTLPEKVFASVSMDGGIVGVGFGVRENEWVGLFSLVTLDNYRRQGVALSINSAIAEWGRRRGAAKCYLQVETENKPALRLYNKLGFEEVYRYWYRVRRN